MIKPLPSFLASLCLLAASAVIAAEHEVIIERYAYSPAELEIAVGDTVTWVNREKRTSHSIIVLGSDEESERLFPGERWTRNFVEEGLFEYSCGPHPEMKGRIIVKP